ncbi:MAG TPA: cysteine synthase family protein [Anaerolineales bacterium]|nr:cysteine synthase family protein [Anaerolineales bacterium]
MALQTESPPRQLSTQPDPFGPVGNTPLIPLERITEGISPDVRLYAKAEWFNPSGSVKDRPAEAILRGALEDGSLSGSRVLLDSTSGNMGIAYATFAARMGLRVHLALPANASPQRIAILKALGADLTLTDPSEGSDGARLVAAEMAASDPDAFYYADQYRHPANWQAHFRTTGPEVARQTDGRLTHFVAGLGTTGTLTGTGRYLREAISGVRLVAVQPATPLHGLEGLKHLPSSPVPDIFDPTVPDETLPIETDEAFAMARRLAREEGLLVGISAAAAAVAALKIASELEQGWIVAIFPDSGWKYLGQPFWEAE